MDKFNPPFPPKGFGSERRLAYIAATQDLIHEGLTKDQVLDRLMDEGITEAKARDYYQQAERRERQNKTPPYGL